MSHFYGTLSGSRGQATRQGTKASGLLTIAASWAGCIKVDLYVDEQDRDCFVVYQELWQGAGIRQEITRGIIGQLEKQDRKGELNDTSEALATCEMMLRLIEGENLDERFDGEATILRDTITHLKAATR